MAAGPTRSLLLSILLALPVFGQAERSADVRSIAPNILNDQKNIWTAPAHITQRRYLIPTLVIAGTAAALIASDPHSEDYFHSTRDLHHFNNVFSGTNTAALIVATPAAFYVAGRGRTSSYSTQTAWLTGEALVDSEIVDYALKTAFNRRTPGQFKDPSANLSDSWFDAPGSRLGANGSFPSGHTIAAFSVATVLSRRYGRRHPWVTWTAYGVAGLVGFSRLTTSAHYPSDIFVGAALGYSISRFAVLRQPPELP